MRKNLKLARIAAGMTLGDLARATGIGLSTLGNYEKGRTNLSAAKLDQVAAVLKNDSQHLAVLSDDYPVGPLNRELASMVAEASLPEVQHEIRVVLDRIEIELRHMKNRSASDRARFIAKAISILEDYDAHCEREYDSLRQARHRVVESSRDQHTNRSPP